MAITLISGLPQWLSVAVLLLVPLMIILKKLSQSRANHPPGPPSLPFIGNLHQFSSLPHRDLTDLSKKYGDVVTVKLGKVRTVVVHSPETAEQVLRHNDLSCCTRPQIAITKTFFYNGLGPAFSKWGDYYKDVRKLCVLELFNSQRASSFAYIREEELNRLLASLSESASTGSPVDLTEKLVRYVANLTCRVAFGVNFSGSRADNEKFIEVFKATGTIIGEFAAADMFPFGWIVDRLTGLTARTNKTFKELDEFYETAIKQHLLKGKIEEGREDLIDVLLKLQKEDSRLGSKPITHDHIKSILMDVFTAGTDTSSITVDWIMAELVRHPRVLKKAQSEIRGVVGNRGKVTHEDLDHLEYMRMIIKETWRLHINLPLLIPREAMSKFQINGYNIYPGTRIHVNAWAIGRSPKVWKDPEAFYPERFIDSPIDPKGTNFELLPFGSGRRGCPGLQMGLTNVEFTLANLLYHFEWTLPTGMSPEDVSIDEAPGISIHRKHPLMLVPVKYKSA